MDVNITNTTLNWREVRLTLDKSTLDMGWSADYVMDGDQLVISPRDWNKRLAPGADTTVGFCGTGHNNVSLTSAMAR